MPLETWKLTAFRLWVVHYIVMKRGKNMNIKMPKMRNFELNQQLRACGHKVVKDKKKWTSKNQCRGKVKF